MNPKIALATLLLTAALSVACDDDDDTPTGPGGGQNSCEVNHTATVEFRNESRRSTYTIMLDGAKIGTIGPDESFAHVLAAGQHSVRFVFANTTNEACNSAQPVFAQCSNMYLSCSSDL